jgi:hypothetical protein
MSESQGFERYGQVWPTGTTDVTIELVAFREGFSPERGGLGKYAHFRKIVEMLWPYDKKKNKDGFQWNPWAERIFEAACEHRFLGISGPKSSSKTHCIGIWGLVNWLADPFNTLVLVTTTSVREARKRMWGVIRERHLQVPGLPGKIIDSMGKLIMEDAGSDRSSITLIPSAKDKEKEATEKLIGLKNKRVFLLVDEATDVSPAIFEAVHNLDSNPFFQIIALGNFASSYDPFGQFITPINTWNSVNCEMNDWPITRGHCIHLDGEKTPNLDADDQWPFLLTSKQLRDAKEYQGENSLSYWRFIRSFPSPIGAEQNIYSEADIRRYEGEAQPVWDGSPIKVAGFDPAFTNGGDRSVLYIGAYGKTTAGITTVAFGKPFLLREDSTRANEPRNFQIARQVREICEKEGVRPEHLAVDATGAGDPFCDILSEMWSPRIYRVKFGEKPTMLPTSGISPVKANEKFSNRVTELWYVGVEFLRAGQLKGITPDLAREFTARKYSTMSGGKLVVEPKKDMKARMGKSPDLADAAFMLLDICRHRLGAYAGGKLVASRGEGWLKQTVKMDISSYQNRQVLGLW